MVSIPRRQGGEAQLLSSDNAPNDRRRHPIRCQSSSPGPNLIPNNIRDEIDLHACAMMRILPTALLLLLCVLIATADDIVTKGRIKVQLFAAPAFVSEVSVDAYNNQCLSLDNNLYDEPSLNSVVRRADKLS